MPLNVSECLFYAQLLVQVVLWRCFDAAGPPASDWHPLNAADPWAAPDLFLVFEEDSVLGSLAFQAHRKVLECCCSYLFHYSLSALWQIHNHLIFPTFPFADLYHPLPPLL